MTLFPKMFSDQEANEPGLLVAPLPAKLFELFKEPLIHTDRHLLSGHQTPPVSRIIIHNFLYKVKGSGPIAFSFWDAWGSAFNS